MSSANFSKHATRPDSIQPAVWSWKFAPAMNAGSIVLSDSKAACASTICAEVSPPPPERQSSP